MSHIGIFSCDPGGATGLAWAVVDKDVPLQSGMVGRLPQYSGSSTVTGLEENQIAEIAALWAQFRTKCVVTLRIPIKSVDFVMEDFILRPGPHGGGKEGISPARIAWGVHGFRMGRAFEYELHGLGPSAPIHTVWQNPSDASGFGTSERLRDWGCWVRGREHERSAWRHLALRLSRIRSR